MIRSGLFEKYLGLFPMFSLPRRIRFGPLTIRLRLFEKCLGAGPKILASELKRFSKQPERLGIPTQKYLKTTGTLLKKT
jgi:hypothetical protein